MTPGGHRRESPRAHGHTIKHVYHVYLKTGGEIILFMQSLYHANIWILEQYKYSMDFKFFNCMSDFQNTTGHFTERLCFCRRLFGPPTDCPRKHSPPVPCSPDTAVPAPGNQGAPWTWTNFFSLTLPQTGSDPAEPKKWSGKGQALGGANPEASVIPLQKQEKERG